ncbi:MAG: type II secretion system F family protein [Candidatus Aminicenantes bacterium]|nr:MAG: type II secretion system F family protein [Candidatus Aminicenantes bacterium]
MPYYICRVATEDGSVISESFLSPSYNECRRRFEEQGFCVLSIKRDWKKIEIPLLPFEKKIKDKDFILFNQELVALIKAGYPVVKSIDVILSRIKNHHLRELLMAVQSDIRSGKSLSEAFAPYEDQFSTVYLASLMAGERSANLDGTIKRYIDYAKIISMAKSKIRAALTYPTLLLFFSLLLLLILINFVIPRFSQFYADFESQLPSVTRSLMAFSFFVKGHLLYLFVFVLLLFLGYLLMKRKEETQILLHRAKLRIPYGRGIWLESAISLFCRTLSLLLEGGISLLTAVGIASKAVPNKFLQHLMRGLSDSIKNGESLSESLVKSQFFTPLAVDMIRIGESSANLEGMLADVADVYDERIRGRIDTFVSLIEPVVIIFMGLIVAAMLLSVYLPIFNVIQVTR